MPISTCKHGHPRHTCPVRAQLLLLTVWRIYGKLWGDGRRAVLRWWLTGGCCKHSLATASTTVSCARTSIHSCGIGRIAASRGCDRAWGSAPCSDAIWCAIRLLAILKMEQICLHDCETSWDASLPIGMSPY